MDLLDQLDPEQRAAAEALVGPVVILAGAGTGKTRTITHRIAHGIAKGYYSANRVLALTYTNRAAGELRQRLRQLGIPGVSVKTFHAAALAQLEFFWPQFAGVPAPSVIESKAKLINQVAQEAKIVLDAPAVREFAAEIEWRKYSMLSLEEYAQAKRPQVAGLSAQKNLELQQAYENAKVTAQRLDWEDVLVLTIGLLRSEPRALAHVQQQYRFFTVDEYQDISPLQHALLDLWLGDRSDLCVVGDPNQTIYSFTGASSAFLHSFSERFSNCTTVQLTRNYRSTGSIVSAANRLVADQSQIAPLESQREVGEPPVEVGFDSLVAEAKAVAESISMLISQGTPAREIAVLYRVNGQSEAFENALAKRGIGLQVKGGDRFFNRRDVQAAVRGLRAEAVVKPELHPFEVMTNVIRALGWQAQPPAEAGPQRETWEALNSLLEIAGELPESANASDLVHEMEERQRSQHEPVVDAVTLSTIHAAKGLEWDVVFVVGVTEGYLPIGFAKTDAELAEERRLFYVAMTRAKRILRLTWPRRDETTNRGRERSRFLADIAARH